MNQVSRAWVGLVFSLSVGGIILGYAWWRSGVPPPKSALQNNRTFSFEPGAVQRVETRHGSQRIIVLKESSGWFVQQPVRMKAADDKITVLLEAIRNLRPQVPWRDVEEAPPLTSVGLSSPQSTLQIFDHNDQPIAGLNLGEKSEYNGMRYAELQHADGTRQVAMLSDDVQQTLVMPLQNLIERRVLGNDHERVLRLQVERLDAPQGIRSFELERVASVSKALFADATFVVRLPHSVGADEKRAADLLRAFSATPVARFLTFDHQNRFTDFSLDAPAIVVRAEIAVVDSAGNPTKEIRNIRIGKPLESPSGGTIVRVARDSPPWVGEVNAGLYHSLMLEPEDLIDVGILRFDTERVVRIVIQRDGSPTFEMERASFQDTPVWRSATSGHVIENEKVQSMLLTFSDLSGAGKIFLPEGETLSGWWVRHGVQDDNGSSIRFLGGQGAILGELLLGVEEGNSTFVRPKDVAWIARLPKVKLRVLPSTPKAWLVSTP